MSTHSHGKPVITVQRITLYMLLQMTREELEIHVRDHEMQHMHLIAATMKRLRSTSSSGAEMRCEPVSLFVSVLTKTVLLY